MEYVSVETVSKLFDELYDWDKKKFIEKLIEKYETDYCDVKSIDDVLDYYGIDDILAYVSKFWNTDEILSEFHSYEILNYIKYTLEEEELINGVSDACLLDECLKRCDIKDIIKKINDEDRDTLLKIVLGDEEGAVPR
jgi:hypothetical protein